jgi:hypothetical protein
MTDLPAEEQGLLLRGLRSSVSRQQHQQQQQRILLSNKNVTAQLQCNINTAVGGGSGGLGSNDNKRPKQRQQLLVEGGTQLPTNGPRAGVGMHHASQQSKQLLS